MFQTGIERYRGKYYDQLSNKISFDLFVVVVLFTQPVEAVK